MRIAAIDIGTVTARLLIADVYEGVIGEVVRDIEITQLGSRLSQSGALSDTGMQNVYEAVRRFVVKISENKVDKIICIATSAARDAHNGETFEVGLRACGIEPHIISGQTEARLSFRGATYRRRGDDLLVIDPGGGSTEFIFRAGENDAVIAQSMHIGSRRLTDMFIRHDPVSPEELADIRTYIKKIAGEYFLKLPHAPRELVAVAGTATTLVTMKYEMADYDPLFVHGKVITREDLSHSIEQLCAKTQKEREAMPGLEPKRASVILAGCLIIEQVLEISRLSMLTISDYDILYGIILSVDLF